MGRGLTKIMVVKGVKPLDSDLDAAKVVQVVGVGATECADPVEMAKQGDVLFISEYLSDHCRSRSGDYAGQLWSDCSRHCKDKYASWTLLSHSGR